MSIFEGTKILTDALSNGGPGVVMLVILGAVITGAIAGSIACIFIENRGRK